MKRIFSLLPLLPALLAVHHLQALEKNHTRNVAIFLQDGVEILDIAGPGEVFAATRVKGKPMFNVYTVAANRLK